MFNKAAKNIKVDESEAGDIKVEMNLDKSDLSTKKMRKKMMKKVRNQLYSNFVKSGTLTGGKMEEVEQEQEMETVKDMSKIKELSDDQLVAACGGLTAHKGARHGLNMKAKLDRIAEAELEFMKKYGGGGDISVAEDANENSEKSKSNKKKKRKYEDKEPHKENLQAPLPSKKKKKRDKVKEVEEVVQLSEEPTTKKKIKKHKKDKSK